MSSPTVPLTMTSPGGRSLAVVWPDHVDGDFALTLRASTWSFHV
jgi:hypothetical protein